MVIQLISLFFPTKEDCYSHLFFLRVHSSFFVFLYAFLCLKTQFKTHLSKKKIIIIEVETNIILSFNLLFGT